MCDLLLVVVGAGTIVYLGQLYDEWAYWRNEMKAIKKVAKELEQERKGR